MRVLITAVLLAAAAAAPVAAMPIDTDSFHDKASGYRVDVSHDGDTMLLDGYNVQRRERFHLMVTAAGRVSGNYEGRTINYVMGRAPTGEFIALNSAR